MKKRVFSLFMALALCLSMLPAAAMADESEELVQEENGTSAQSGETHEHYLCGGDECTKVGHSETDKTTFTAWTDAEAAEQYPNSGKTASNSLPKSATLSNYYYLTEDVVLEAEDSTWSPLSGMRLCLNGHSITTKKDNAPAILVSGGTFTLVDCKGNKGEYGKITHVSGFKGHGVEQAGGTFNMYGGKISGNTATNCGGGVYMTGSCNFNMYGGQITGNSTTYYGGGGVFIGSASTFAMYGGQITGNNCMSGDYTHRGGGGVYNGGTMTVSGDVTITGNVKDGTLDSDTGKYTGGTANNVYLVSSNKTITIDGALTGGAGSIGVSTSTKLKAGESVTIAEGKNYTLKDDDLKAFSSDAGDPYHIQKDENTLKLANTADAPHAHFLCTTDNTCTKVGGHTENGKTTFEKSCGMMLRVAS